jgi:hypothetical protein
MRRESRLNLIVIGCVLLLVLPGAVILVKKKSQPGERAIGSPDPVRTTTAWMDPYPEAAVTRLAPLRSLQWLSALAMEGTPGDSAERVIRKVPTPFVKTDAPSQTPGNVGEAIFYGQQPAGSAAAQVISDHCWFQVISRGPNPAPWLRLVVWDEDQKRGDAFTVDVDGKPERVLAVRQVPMPIEVRHDLQEAGYVLPPERVWVMDVAAPAGGGTSVTLMAGKRTDSVALP